MTHEGQNLMIEGYESSIRQIKEMIEQKQRARTDIFNAWTTEIRVLTEHMEEYQELLITLKNNR